MKPARALILILVATATAVPAGCTTAPSGPPPPPPPGKTWSLKFDVGFDGDRLDTTKLSPCFDWNYDDNCTSTFNKGLEHYLPSQVQLKDGIAHLVAEPLDPPRKDDACENGLCTYKSGLVSTARPNPKSDKYLYSFRYGYAEARMKLPSTPGMFTAFWMLPTHPDYRYNYEIDILENLAGRPGVIYQTYHYNNRNTSYKVNDIIRDTNGTCPKLQDYASAFHTYGADWQPDHVSFYIDGSECGRFSATDAEQIANEPMQIIVDLMVNTSWEREAGLTLASQGLKDQLDIDYIRVWQAE